MSFKYALTTIRIEDKSRDVEIHVKGCKTVLEAFKLMNDSLENLKLGSIHDFLSEIKVDDSRYECMLETKKVIFQVAKL